MNFSGIHTDFSLAETELELMTELPAQETFVKVPSYRPIDPEDATAAHPTEAIYVRPEVTKLWNDICNEENSTPNVTYKLTGQ
jgi:hypothetical protein